MYISIVGIHRRQVRYITRKHHAEFAGRKNAIDYN
jgi:hypothetical protein